MRTQKQNTKIGGQAFNYTNIPAMHEGPYLATERAGVFGVLGDFNFLHHLPQRCTITGAIFTNDPHLLGALGL